MMTIHKLTAGDGYLYYLRHIASADVDRKADQSLGDYYAASGTPPGVWTGSGAAALGVSGTVDEAQMRALYGEGLHPNADQIIRAALAAGAGHKQAIAQARLGRRYYRYDEDCGPLAARIESAIRQTADGLGRALSDTEREETRQQVGAESFLNDFGRAPRDPKELSTYIRALTGPARQAVAGWDLVFRPEQGIQELWALATSEPHAEGDHDVRLAVEAAHEQAIAETLAWLEKNALATRTGANGIAQEDVASGLIATRFRHYDSRLGDPLLHDHVVVSNKVRGMDGKWRTLDGKLLHAMGVAASELYNQRVVEEVCHRLGLRAEERIVTPGRRPVLTIAGVDHDLMRTHSKRSIRIRKRTEHLVDDYRRRHGHEPDTAALIALAQRATLETRPRKKESRSLQEMRAAWRAEAVAIHGQSLVDGLLASARAAAAAPESEAVRAESIDVAEVADSVLSVVSEERSVWGWRHVLAEARRQVTALTAAMESAGDLPERVAEHALSAGSLLITPAELHKPFAPLQRADGTSIYRRREHELYTSETVLAAERRILNAARLDVIPAVARRHFAAAADRFPGPPLDAGQRHQAAEFACSERLLVAGIGPAGAGKTTALALVAQTVTESGGRLIALAPSARTAKVFEQSLAEAGGPSGAVEAHTLHAWLHQRARAAAGAEVDEAFTLRPGDVLVVDEAGLAGTRRIARVVEQAETAGAVVRLIGDYLQLGSVESGGALRLLAREVGAVELESLYRFRTAGEAEASLRLRDGAPADAWTWYVEQERVTGGAYEKMVDAVFAAWQADTIAGKRALMTADTADAVGDLNARAQAFQLASGRLDPSGIVPVRKGVHAMVGDVIVSRRNARRFSVFGGKDWVKNGDLWQIESLFTDGSVTARNTVHGGRVVLPATYLREHAELGYASTVHRAQGLTVDRAHCLLSGGTARGAAYAALTRGRESNHAYAVCEAGQRADDVLAQIVANERPSISAHEEIRRAQDRVTSLGQLVAEYADAHSRATAQRMHAVARSVLGPAAERLIGAHRWNAVERALLAAEVWGWDAKEMLRRAYIVRPAAAHSADELALMLAEQIDTTVAAGARAAAAARPLARLSGPQLDALESIAERARKRALEELCRADAAASALPRPVIVKGVEVPAWTERQHGQMTAGQLVAAVEAASSRVRGRAMFSTPEEEDHYRRLYASLRREQHLRRSMRWMDRAREDWQREPRGSGGPPHLRARAALDEVPARQSAARAALRRAEAAAARIRAEQQVRRRLPPGPAVPPRNRGVLPDWVAPSAAVRSPDTPAGWRRHLLERRAVLTSQLRMTGAMLADAPPTWCAPLGAPAAEGSALRPAWESTAALVSLWRARHAIPLRVPGIGRRPSNAQEAAAWDALQERIARLARASSRLTGRQGERRSDTSPPPSGTADTAQVGGDSRPRPYAIPAFEGSWAFHSTTPQPSGPVPLAAAQAIALASQLVLRAEQDLAIPADDDDEMRAAAEDMADRSLEAVLTGQGLADPWVGELPPPDPADPADQERWRRLVAELAVYRMLHQVTTLTPLGDAPMQGEDQGQRAALQSALDALQRARIEQRLAQIRERRDADRARRGISSSTPRRQHPPATPGGLENQQQHRFRPPSPGGPGPGRRS